jgi:ATP-dependent helicase/nuclease subunit A
VSIVDYKTNRPAPATLRLRRPMSFSSHSIVPCLPLYPGREVSAALLFTEAPRLIELPPAAMDEALARLTGRDTRTA